MDLDEFFARQQQRVLYAVMRGEQRVREAWRVARESADARGAWVVTTWGVGHGSREGQVEAEEMPAERPDVMRR